MGLELLETYSELRDLGIDSDSSYEITRESYSCFGFLMGLQGHVKGIVSDCVRSERRGSDALSYVRGELDNVCCQFNILLTLNSLDSSLG